jgi:type I restriction enzyme, S subunit
MNAERLLAHYERIADAPDAIVRLRRFVLDLAVRGKLVPQDPNDEPASELLKRIENKKGRSARASAPNDGQKFQTPVGWTWTTLGAVSNVVMGQSPPGDSYNIKGEGVPLINGPVEFTEGPFGKTVVNQYTTAPTKFCDEGDLLICVRGSTTGRTNIAGFRACIGRGVAAIQPCFEGTFVRLFIWNARDSIINMGRGIAFPSVSVKQIEGLAIPLPPLAEQHRIVAKVDELMVLCDRLEAARAEREATRDRFTAATFARLNAPDPESFHEDARFALDALPGLTACADQINQLRQTILGLGVVGKLTPSTISGLPGVAELNIVSAKKLELELRKPKVIAPISFDEHWCELPKLWEWARWDQITDWITYGFTRPMPHAENGVPIVTGKNVNRGKIIFETADRTPIASYQELSDKDRPKRGDILITKDGSIGRTAIVENEGPFCINQSVAVLWLRSCHFDRRFLQMALDCPQTQEALLAKTEGVAIKHISIIDLGKMVFPLPPLAEQHSIVAKVDELMALCDQLERSLINADDARGRLLDALLAEALTPDDHRELKAAE